MGRRDRDPHVRGVALTLTLTVTLTLTRVRSDGLSRRSRLRRLLLVLAVGRLAEEGADRQPLTRRVADARFIAPTIAARAVLGAHALAAHRLAGYFAMVILYDSSYNVPFTTMVENIQCCAFWAEIASFLDSRRGGDWGGHRPKT